jgi:nucleotide-binding universal stress UspA family protein
MIQIRRILCPTDFSDHSRHAFDHAVALARWYDAQITVLHVQPLVPSATVFPPVMSPITLDPIPRDRVIDEVRRFSEPATAAGVRTDVALGQGPVPAEILDLARALPADLLVMGTHGRGGFERLVLGSVAEKVLRKACCPVLTVPPLAEPGVGAGPPLFARILCPVDFSPSSMKALGYALSLAQEAKASLTVLHVLEWSPDQDVREHRHFDVLGYRRYLEEEALRSLHAAIPEEARLWCQTHEVVAAGKARLEIARAAREGKADLIVMGVQGRGAVDVMLFGSTAHHVIRESHLPVLTIRGR